MKYRAIFIIISLWLIQSIHPINPIKLAGMNDVTWLGKDSQKAKNYLPFWGLPMVEKNIAQLWYQINGKYQQKKIEDLVKQSLSDLLNQETFNSCLSQLSTTKTQDLLRQMFHIAGGTFAVTNAGNNPVRQFTAYHIGKILRMICDADEKYDEELEKKIKDYCVTLNFKDQSGAIFKPKGFNPFVKSLVAALQESIGAEKLYAENTVQQILLGFMLQRSHELKDLIDYYQGFSGQKLSDDALKNRKEYTNAELVDMAATKVDVSDISQFADYICALTYVQNYASPLPKIAGNMSVDYNKKYFFSDCVETTMLNLANIVTYDSAKKLLGQSSDQIKFSSVLQSFYDQDLHKNPTEVQNSSVHNAWANIVENMNYVAYLNAGFNGKRISSECDGFMPIPGPVDAEMIDKQNLKEQQVKIDDKNYMLYEKQVGSRKYLLVPRSSGLECFEIMPLASNIIVMMNNLFDLNLYVSADEVLQQNFTQKYFKSMCSKVGLMVENSDLDKEFEKNSIVLKLSTMQGSSFDIHLQNKAHGYISVNEQNIRNNILNKKLNAEKISEQIQAVLISYGMMSEDLLDNMSQQLYKNIAANNADKRLDLIHDILEKNDTNKMTEEYVASLIVSMSEFSDPHYHDISIDNDTLSKTIAHALYVMSQAVLIKYDDFTGFFKFYKCFVQYNLVHVDEILKMVEQSPYDNVNHTQNSLKLLTYYIDFANLFTVNHVDAILKAINSSLHSVDAKIQQAALQVVQSCVAHDVIRADKLDLILKDIDNSLHNKSFDVQLAGLQVVQSCIQSRLFNNLHEVLNLIADTLYNENVNVQIKGLYILDSCVKHDLIKSDQLDLILKAIADNLYSEDGHVQQAAFRVISSCVKHNLMIADDILSKIEQSLNDQFELKKGLLSFFYDCIDRNILFTVEHRDKIWKIIDSSVHSKNFDVQLIGLKILRSCLSNNLIKADKIDLILNLIVDNLYSENVDVQKAALQIVYSCVSKNLIKSNKINDVLKIIKSNLNSEDEKVSTKALNLVSDFLQQNLVTADTVNSVLKAIENSLNSENNVVKYSALELVNLIAEKNLLSGSAKDQIEQALKDTHKGSLVERRNAIVKIQEYVASLKVPQVNVSRTSMLDATKKSVFSSTRSNLMRFKIPNELSKGDDATAHPAVPSEKDLNNQRAQLEKFQQMMDVRNNSLPQTTGIRGKVYDGSSSEYARQLSEYGRQVPVVKNLFMDPTKIALAARRSVARALAK